MSDDAGVPHLYIASNRPGGAGLLDIYVSELAGGVFQPPTLVQGLNTAQADLTPSIRFDGLEIILASNRPGGAGGFDLWAAVRDTVAGPWSTPLNLSTVNSVSSESFPSIAADQGSLFFDSARAGGFGGSDLYVSTRER